MVIRYGYRVYAYSGFLHEDYPPFEFETTPSDSSDGPTRIELAPALDDRNRLTVGLRFIWIIPAAIVTILIGIVAAVCSIIAFFVVLFTGKWPDGLRSWVMKGMRAGLRLSAYMFLITDEYPPMTFDDVDAGPQPASPVGSATDAPPPPPPPPPSDPQQ